MPRKEDSESVRRSQQLRDRSRNEQQKSMLLKESYTLRQERTAQRLCEQSKKIMERSQKLCEQAENLRNSKNKAG